MSWIDTGISIFLICIVFWQALVISEHRRAIDTLISYIKQTDDVNEEEIVIESAKELINDDSVL